MLSNIKLIIRNKSSLACVITVFVALLSSCGEKEFKVKGEIDGIGETPVVLEKSDFNGQWLPVDSTRTSPKGSFSISSAAPAAPEVYRLHVGSDYIYFPVDSTETVSVGGSVPGLGVNYTLSGSDQAVKMAEFDHALSAAAASGGDLGSFKRDVYERYIRDSRGSLLSYYVLTKTVADKPLFDPANPADLKYYAAVATAFKQFNPTSPRLGILEETALRALRNRNANAGRKQVLEAGETSAIEIALPGEDGNPRRLTDLLGNGKRTLVVFSMLTHPDAHIVNKEIAKYHSAGTLNVYQVSLDADQYGWREAAANLPWINVIDPEGEHSSTALKYNVSSLPAFFLYNTAGELVARADDLEQLGKILR